MALTKERMDKYQWIGPLLEVTFGFYVKADSNIVIRSLDDAKKVVSIGVFRNDVREKFLTQESSTNLDLADDNVTNFKKLMVGRFVMYASANTGIKFEAERAGYQLSDVKLAYPFMKNQLFIAFSKSIDAQTYAEWDSAFEAMKKDGTFKTIFKKYYPDLALPGPSLAKF